MVDRTIILLALGSSAAIAWGAYEWLRPLPLPAAPSAPATTVAPPLSVPTPYIGDIDAFNEITERPLFTVGRRPAPKNPAGTGTEETSGRVAGPDDISGMRLTAVVTDGDQLTALVEGPGGKTEKLQIGSRLSSWQVDQIQDDRIILEADGRRQTLEVYRFDVAPVVKRAPRRPPRLTRRPRVVPTPPQPTLGPGTSPAEPDDSESTSKDPAQ
jgi:hypothetical protein